MPPARRLIDVNTPVNLIVVDQPMSRRNGRRSMRCVKRGASKPPTMALRATCRNDEVARKGVYTSLLVHRRCALALAGLRPTPRRARSRVDRRLPGVAQGLWGSSSAATFNQPFPVAGASRCSPIRDQSKTLHVTYGLVEGWRSIATGDEPNYAASPHGVRWSRSVDLLNIVAEPACASYWIFLRRIVSYVHAGKLKVRPSLDGFDRQRKLVCASVVVAMPATRPHPRPRANPGNVDSVLMLGRSAS
jgi:hypothetical protein